MTDRRHRIVRALRALGLLTASTVRRLLREGMVLRSMVWPGLVVVGTLAATVGVLAAFRPAPEVAVPAGAVELASWLEEGGFNVHAVADPRRAVVDKDLPVGTDGRTLWARGTSTTALDVEQILRQRLGASWVPQAPVNLPDLRDGRQQGRMISRMLGMLFVMYGTVFGLGSVARDRDDGSLEAELALPVPRWIGGLSRWLAAVIVLSVFYTVCVVMLAAVIGVDDAPSTIRHGVAACAGGVAVGLMVVGTAGIKQGFSGPLSAALTGVTALAALGALGVSWVPIASLFAGGSGYASLLVSGLLGLAAAAIYARRTGRS